MHIGLVCMLSSNAVLLLFLLCLSLRGTTEKREWRGEKIVLRVVTDCCVFHFISFRFSPIFAIVKILWDWFKGQHETNTVASSAIDKDPADEGTRALGLMQHATAIGSLFVVQIILRRCVCCEKIRIFCYSSFPTLLHDLIINDISSSSAASLVAFFKLVCLLLMLQVFQLFKGFEFASTLSWLRLQVMQVMQQSPDPVRSHDFISQMPSESNGTRSSLKFCAACLSLEAVWKAGLVARSAFLFRKKFLFYIVSFAAIQPH